MLMHSWNNNMSIGKHCNSKQPLFTVREVAVHTRIRVAGREMLPVFVICGDSDNFLLWLRRVWIQFFLQTSGKAHPT